MRHPFALLLTLCLCAFPPTSSAHAADKSGDAAQAQAPDLPSDAEVLEYLRLFGYGEMMEMGAAHQLDALIELFRQSRPDLAPGVLDLIHQELRAELKAAAEQSLGEMVAVFKRHMTRQDVRYLIGVGRDPRMQRVVRMQPGIARDMEIIGERLAEIVTAKAAPKIEERLRMLQGGQEL